MSKGSWILIWAGLFLGLMFAYPDDEMPFDGPERRPLVGAGFEEILVSAGDTPPGFVPQGSIGGDRKRPGGTYTGTAFALVRDEVWATARHVVDDCKTLALRSDDGWLKVTSAFNHTSADASLILTEGAGRGGLRISREKPQSTSNADTAYAFGYPQGKHGALEAVRLAPLAVKVDGDFKSRRAAWGHFWAVNRYPLISDRKTIGGISGGPVIGADGDVDGIIVGSNPRRARVITIDPQYIYHLFAAANRNQDAPELVEFLNSTNFDEVGHRLEEDHLIAKVYCEG